MNIQGVNVVNLMTYLINEVACTMEYDSWSNDFRHKDLKGYYEFVQKEMSKIDFNKLTDEELKFLGFKKLSEKSEGYLVPLWLLRVLPKGMKLMSILGEIVEVGVDYIDNDVRGGCTAYMLIQN
ncbi:hypothetical protein MOE90_20255 [Bacillus spizizenii]|nr:hypothetical protein [Bacillus spizizenii]MCY9124972.1 hypothetical protein [Bacillus spizizenii]